MNNTNEKSEHNSCDGGLKPEGGSQPDLDSQLDPSYPHLLRETTPFLLASVKDRIDRINSDRYILHEQARVALSAMKETCSMPNDVIRPRCLAVIGDPDEGKSALLSRFVRDCGNNETLLEENDGYIPILVVNLMARATQPSVALSFTRALRQTSAGNLLARHVSDNIYRTLAAKRVRVVIINEFHHLGPISASERQVVYDFVKGITELKIHVIVVGTEKAREKLAEDGQMSSRFRVVRLRSLAKGKELKDFLYALETFYPLPMASDLGSHMDYIYSQTNGITGEVVALCNSAATYAVRKGLDRIDLEVLKKAKLLPPANAA